MMLLARILSDISNPFIVSLPMPYLIVYKATHDSLYALKWSVLTFLFILFVGLFVVIGVRKKLFSDFDVSKREQRKPLFLFTAGVTLIYLFFIFYLQGPTILAYVVVGFLCGLGVISIINTRIKASVHVATVSALIVALCLLYGGLFFATLILIPLIAWSRVVTKRHTIQEALIGGIFGSVLILTLYSVIQFI